VSLLVVIFPHLIYLIDYSRGREERRKKTREKLGMFSPEFLN